MLKRERKGWEKEEEEQEEGEQHDKKTKTKQKKNTSGIFEVSQMPVCAIQVAESKRVKKQIKRERKKDTFKVMENWNTKYTHSEKECGSVANHLQPW